MSDDHRSIMAATEGGLVGIGWDFSGADIASMSRKQIGAAYASSHPDESKGKVAAATGQVSRFVHDVGKGSVIVMYAAPRRASTT